MIDLLLEHAGDPGRDGELKRRLAGHVAAVKASAHRGDRSQVAKIERLVRAEPEASFAFHEGGAGEDGGRAGGAAVNQAAVPPATLSAGRWSFPAGRFETPSLATLRARVQRRCAAVPDKDGARSGAAARARLWVLLGASPATDIGSLQATAGPGTVFQVASQFNCLEAPGAYVIPVADYFHDSTQGPRAAISAFPGTFLRHYAAPGPDGSRFVQQTGGPQLDLLEAVCAPGVARVHNGYLTAGDIRDPAAFAAALDGRFDEIRVGVHSEVPVILGYEWDGAVEGDRRIDQVLTSTFAGGGYSPGAGGLTARGAAATSAIATGADYESICRSLLRAAYLGAVLAAVSLGRRKVVLTLIGGGAFGNPIPLIWDSILWAVDEVDRMGCRGLEVVVNSRNLGSYVPREEIEAVSRGRGGAVVEP